MCILTTFLYLFQALPIKIPLTYFRQVHSLFIMFVWAHKKTCLPRHLLSLPKQYGGLALPDIRKYYQTIHLGSIIDWCRLRCSKLWVQMEQAQTDILLMGALWCYGHLLPSKSHPLLGTTLRISSHVSMQNSLSSSDSPLFPFMGNPRFSPGLDPHTIWTLQQLGRVQASHFLVGGLWPSI